MPTAERHLRVLPAGDAAVTIELGDAVDLETCAQVRALDRALAERPFAGFVESVPTVRSLLVLFDPARASGAGVAEYIREHLPSTIDRRSAGRRHEIPVRYGDEDGPDLVAVADRLGLSPAEVVARHSAVEYTALMLGFTPGFAYLGLLPPELRLPRRATPRTRVPPGSLGLSGPFTGLYPSASAGGWHLIGRASVPLFDPLETPPARLAPGDRVRFVASRDEAPRTTPSPLRAGERSEATVEILEGGALTTVQDLGRTGYRRYGVAASGALDPRSLIAANRAVGNADGAAGLECTLVGPSLRFLRISRFAVAGADLGAVLWRSDLGGWSVPHGRSVLARPGNVLSFAGRRSGCRAYIAFAGGIDVPRVMGACATDVGSGFGGVAGRAVQTGDILSSGTPSRSAAVDLPPTDAPSAGVVELRVTAGPQADALDDRSRARLEEEEFVVSRAADRAGIRLDGPRLEHRASAEIVSDGMPLGSIQVPPDGAPILMANEGPTTGGYVKPLVILSADLPRLGQLVPGETRVRFRMTTLD